MLNAEEDLLMDLAADLIKGLEAIPNKCKIIKFMDDKTLVVAHRDARGNFWVQAKDGATKQWSRNTRINN